MRFTVSRSSGIVSIEWSTIVVCRQMEQNTTGRSLIEYDRRLELEWSTRMQGMRGLRMAEVGHRMRVLDI